MANDTSPETGTTKSRNVKYTYRQADGTVSEKFDTDARSVIATVIGSDQPVETSLADVVKDPTICEALADAETGHAMAIMALLFGLKTTIGNALAPANSKGWGTGEMVQALIDRRATIVEDGEWREGGGGGPRTGHIIDAVAAILLADTGKEMNAAGREALKVIIKDKGSKPFTDDPRIAAEIAAANMRRAQAELQRKQAAASEAAKTGGGSILDGLAASLG